MSIVHAQFTASEQSTSVVRVKRGDRCVAQVGGTWTGAIMLQARSAASEGWRLLSTFTANGNVTVTFPDGSDVRMLSAMISTGTANVRLEDADFADQFVSDEWDDLRFPAQAINPAGAVAAPAVDTTESGFPGTLLFDNVTNEMIAGAAQLPHTWKIGSDLRPHIHWSKTTSAAGNVVWHFYYRIIRRGATADAWVGPVVGVDALSSANTAEREAITAFDVIPGSSLSLSQMLCWRIYRMADDAGDTYAADARLFEFDIHYQTDSHGSGAEFLK
jgi:hypothetical protein